MIRAIISLLAIAALASCEAPVGDMPLTDLDLNDSRVVSQIARRLPERERVAFTTYALLHWPGSKNYCGRPIGHLGRAATTVGQAVTQTLKAEADLDKVLKELHAGPSSEIETMRERQALLTDQIEELVQKRDILYASLGAAAQTSDDAKLLEEQMQELQARRATLETRFASTATATM